MRKFCVWLAILAGIASMQAQKTRKPEKTRMSEGMPYAKPGVSYPLTLHLYGFHIGVDCWQGNCGKNLFLDVASNGRKLELSCGGVIPDLPNEEAVPLAVGDLPARILKNGPGTPLKTLGDEYELLLPNKRLLKCFVSGMVE